MKNLFLITVTFMLVLAALSFAQENITLTDIMPEGRWAFDLSSSYFYTGDSGDPEASWRVGINTVAPDGKLEVDAYGVAAGTPVLAVSNTWQNWGNNPDVQSPFMVRRLADSGQALAVWLENIAVYFHYRNDEEYGRILFKIENTDTQDGNPNDANTNTVMTLRGDETTPYGRVGIGTTSPESQLEVYESSTKGTVRIGYGEPANGVTIRSFRSGTGPGNIWSRGLNIESPNGDEGKTRVYFRAYGEGHTLHYAFIGDGITDDETTPGVIEGTTVRFYPETKVTTFQGNVGIGTQTPGAYQLNVNGDVYVDGDITRTGSCGADYVFEEDYELMRLAELKKFIKQNKHLPGMPSAKEIKENGVKLFEQSQLILEKLEEAYLYIIKLEEEVAKLEENNR